MVPHSLARQLQASGQASSQMDLMDLMLRKQCVGASDSPETHVHHLVTFQQSTAEYCRVLQSTAERPGLLPAKKCTLLGLTVSNIHLLNTHKVLRRILINWDHLSSWIRDT